MELRTMAPDMQSGLTPEARAARNKYMRDWHRRNPDKSRAIKDRYWQKKADEALKITEK